MGRQFPHGYLRGGFQTFEGFTWSFSKLSRCSTMFSPENWAENLLWCGCWGRGLREKNPMLEILLLSWRLCILFPSLSQGRWPSRTLFGSHPWFMKDGNFKIINPIVLTWFNKFNLTHLVEEIRTIFRKNNRNNRSSPSICRNFQVNCLRQVLL